MLFALSFSTTAFDPLLLLALYSSVSLLDCTFQVSRDHVILIIFLFPAVSGKQHDEYKLVE